MPRIPRVRRLQLLSLATQPSPTYHRVPFAIARGLSTTSPAQGKNTEWVRGKLWKGEAPGTEDPYTQRAEVEEASNLPEEALQAAQRQAAEDVEGSGLVLPPRRFETATEKKVQADDPSYTPATTMAELESIPSLDTWWDQPGHLGEESQFKGFCHGVKIVDKEVLEVYLKSALVEVVALRESGQFSDWVTKKWADGGRAALDDTLATQLTVQDGNASLQGNASAIVSSVTAESTGVESGRISASEAKEMVATWDDAWKSVTLDQEAKFAIRKRIYQLTGNLISDAKLGATQTVRHVLTLVSKPTTPKKLAELMELQSELADLPNVRIHSKKVGPIDREIEVGRWKIIEEELKKRGLPVTGTGDLPRSKEKEWMKGWA